MSLKSILSSTTPLFDPSCTLADGWTEPMCESSLTWKPLTCVHPRDSRVKTCLQTRQKIPIWGKYSPNSECRGLHRETVYLGWPIAPAYGSPNAGGVARSQPMSSAVHMEPIRLWRSNSMFNSASFTVIQSCPLAPVRMGIIMSERLCFRISTNE